jgi:hypothetical protein
VRRRSKRAGGTARFTPVPPDVVDHDVSTERANQSVTWRTREDVDGDLKERGVALAQVNDFR